MDFSSASVAAQNPHHFRFHTQFLISAFHFPPFNSAPIPERRAWLPIAKHAVGTPFALSSPRSFFLPLRVFGGNGVIFAPAFPFSRTLLIWP